MGEHIRTFRDLDVWRKAHRLAQEVFSLTDVFPRKYLFDLTAQLRRAALSVPTNLAEGSASSHSKELVQFVNVAKRSVSEVQYLLLFALEQRLLQNDRFEALDGGYEELHRMLGGLKRSLGKVTNGRTRHSPLTTRH
jgi:four helix bundle protein